MYMQRRTDSTEAMSVKNAMLGVIDAGIMEVGVYYSVAARTRTISTCGVTAILGSFSLSTPGRRARKTAARGEETRVADFLCRSTAEWAPGHSAPIWLPSGLSRHRAPLTVVR